MSTSIILLPPDDKNPKAVIEDYYDYVLEKHHCLRPNADSDVIEARKQRGLDRLDEGKNLLVHEQVYSRLSTVLDWPAIYDMFSDRSKRVAGPEGASQLVELLKQGKRHLMAGEGPDWDDGLEYTPEETEYELETEVIALCEFAAENGHSIRLSE